MTNSNVKHREGDVVVNGFNIQYLEWDKSGSVIVLLHGSWQLRKAYNLDHLSRVHYAKYWAIQEHA